MPRPQVMFRSYQQPHGAFIPRNFGPEPITTTRKAPSKPYQPAVVPRPTYPCDKEIRDVAKDFSTQRTFRRRNKNLQDAGLECRVSKFHKVYRQIAACRRDYRGRDAIEMDIYLTLKQQIAYARIEKQSVTHDELIGMAAKCLDDMEELIVGMAENGKLVDRPFAPKDARERGGEACTEAAARRKRDSRIRDRITVRAALPNNPGITFFITLGPATRKIDGHRVKLPRRIMALQTPEEWEAWKRVRVREPKTYRNNPPKGRRHRDLLH